jgi:hypothetical protein
METGGVNELIGLFNPKSKAGGVNEFKLIELKVEKLSTPIGAKGLGRPSLLSGTRGIVPSIKLWKAREENILSSKLIVLTFERIDNVCFENSESKTVILFAAVFTGIFETGRLVPEDTKFPTGSSFLITKKYTNTSTNPIPININAFLKVEFMLIF